MQVQQRDLFESKGVDEAFDMSLEDQFFVENFLRALGDPIEPFTPAPLSVAPPVVTEELFADIDSFQRQQQHDDLNAVAFYNQQQQQQQQQQHYYHGGDKDFQQTPALTSPDDFYTVSANSCSSMDSTLQQNYSSSEADQLNYYQPTGDFIHQPLSYHPLPLEGQQQNLCSSPEAVYQQQNYYFSPEGLYPQSNYYSLPESQPQNHGALPETYGVLEQQQNHCVKPQLLPEDEDVVIVENDDVSTDDADEAMESLGQKETENEKDNGSSVEETLDRLNTFYEENDLGAGRSDLHECEEKQIEALYEHDSRIAVTGNSAYAAKFLHAYRDVFQKNEEYSVKYSQPFIKSDTFQIYGTEFIEQQSKRYSQTAQPYLQLPYEHRVDTTGMRDLVVGWKPRKIIAQFVGTPYEVETDFTRFIGSVDFILLETLVNFICHDVGKITAIGFMLHRWVGGIDSMNEKDRSAIFKEHDIAVNLKRGQFDHEISVFAPARLIKTGDRLKITITPKYYSMLYKPVSDAPFEPIALVRVRISVHIDKRARVVAQSQSYVKARSGLGESITTINTAPVSNDEVFQADVVWLAIAGPQELVRSLEADGRFVATPDLVLVLERTYYPTNILGEDFISSVMADREYEPINALEFFLVKMPCVTMKSLVRFCNAGVRNKDLISHEKTFGNIVEPNVIPPNKIPSDHRVKIFFKESQLFGLVQEGIHDVLNAYIRETRDPGLPRDWVDPDNLFIWCSVCDTETLSNNQVPKLHAGFYLAVECGHVFCDDCVLVYTGKPCPKCGLHVGFTQKMTLS